MDEQPRKRRDGKPTMVKVAKAAGVSTFTVSAVVNGSTWVSDELRARVEAAIRDTGYKPSVLAQSLRTGQSKTIGLVVGNITNPFYTDIVSRLEPILMAAGYATMLCSHVRSLAQQDDQLQLLASRHVDGIILSPIGEDAPLQQALDRIGAPVVLIDRTIQGYDCDAVLLDNRGAVSDILKHLAGLGHYRIGFVAGAANSFTGRERVEAYTLAKVELGLDPDPKLIQLGNFQTSDAFSATEELLALEQRPTAILAANNQSVIGVMRALSRHGLRCPEDMSVAVIDDFAWADVFHPTLTAVAQPLDAIAESAARFLLERIGGEATGQGRSVVLSGTLKTRESCISI